MERYRTHRATICENKQHTANLPRSEAGLQSGDAGREPSLLAVVFGVFGEAGSSGGGMESGSGPLDSLREGGDGFGDESGGGVLDSMMASVQSLRSV